MFTFLPPPRLVSSCSLTHPAWGLEDQHLQGQKCRLQMLEGGPWFRLCFSPGQTPGQDRPQDRRASLPPYQISTPCSSPAHVRVLCLPGGLFFHLLCTTWTESWGFQEGRASLTVAPGQCWKVPVCAHNMPPTQALDTEWASRWTLLCTYRAPPF